MGFFSAMRETLFNDKDNKTDEIKAIDKVTKIEIKDATTNTVIQTIEKTEELPVVEEAPEPVEEWIWIEGYKAVSADLTGYNDFQYEIGKTYEKTGHIEECKNGFHLCRRLIDTFKYYDVAKERAVRFFKVSALVRKNRWDLMPINDDDKCNTEVVDCIGYGGWRTTANAPIDKIAARAIRLEEEVSIDDILNTYVKKYPRSFIADYIELARDFYITHDLGTASSKEFKTFVLEYKYYYSYEMSNYIVANDKVDAAIAFGSEPTLTTKERLQFIFNTTIKD